MPDRRGLAWGLRSPLAMTASVVASNLEERQGEAVRAELLMKGEEDKSLTSLRGRDGVPSIVALRQQVEAMSRTELERALRKLPHAPRETRAAFEALVAGIVNEILHPPTVKLREAAGAGAGREWAEVISQLFALSPTLVSGRTAQPTDRAADPNGSGPITAAAR